jgi:hypothetical protein
MFKSISILSLFALITKANINYKYNNHLNGDILLTPEVLEAMYIEFKNEFKTTHTG